MNSSDQDFLKLTSIFVGDLSKFASESDLANLFAPYGPVVDVSIKKNHLTGKTLSYGFVTLASEDMASRAITELDGLIFGGRQLKVRWAMHNVRSQNPMSGGSIVNSLYVKFITPEMNRYINEEDLHRIFSVHGQITDISLKDTTINQHTGLQSGYGFVHFASDSSGMETAFRAMKALDNCLVGELMFHVEPSRNLMKQFSEMERLGAAGTAAADRSEALLSAANVFSAHSAYSAAGMSPSGIDGGNRGGREVTVAGNMRVHGKNTGIIGAEAPGTAIGMHANHYAIPPASSQFYSHDGGGGGGDGGAFSPAVGVGVGSSGNGGLDPNMGGMNPQSSRTMPLGVSAEHYYQMPIAHQHQHQHQNPRQVQYEAIPSSMLGVISPFPPSAFNAVAGGSVPVSGMVPGMGGNLSASSMGVTRLGAGADGGAVDGDSLFSRLLTQPQFNVPTAMLYPMQHSQQQQQQHQQLTTAALNWGMQQRISEIGHIFPGMIGAPMQASMGNVNNLSSSINPPPLIQHQHRRGQGPLGLHGRRQLLQLQQSQHRFQQHHYSHIRQQPPQHHHQKQLQQQRCGLLHHGTEQALPAGAGGSGVSVGATTTSSSSVTTSSATHISRTDRYRNTGVGMSMSMGRGDVVGAGGSAGAYAHEGNQHSMLDSDQPPRQWSTAQTKSPQEPSNPIRVHSKSAPHSPAELGEAQLLSDRGGIGAFGEAEELTAVSSKTVVSLAPSLLPLVERSDSRTEAPGGQYWSVDDQQRADGSSFSSSSFSTSCKIILAPEQQGYEMPPSSVNQLTAGVAGDTVRAGEKDESGGCGGSQETEVGQDAVRRSGVTSESERKNSLQLAASNAGTATEISCGENDASVSADSAMQMLEAGFAEKVSVRSDANTDHKDG